MFRGPDFYLTSSEGYGLEEPRKCWRVKRLAYGQRDDLALIEVEPAIIYQDPHEGNVSLKHIVIAPRHAGASVFSISEWPVYVHVARLKESISPDEAKVKDSNIENIAWAELYPTEQDARRKSA